MSFAHRMQTSRFEYKYIIKDERALEIRDFVRGHLVLDPYADPSHHMGYPVNSLYLDSKGLQLCNDTVVGKKNRFKLRIRYYDDNPTNPVFFEIKRRVNDQILKQRAVVKRQAVDKILAGHWPTREDMFKPNDSAGYMKLQNFCRLKNSIAAIGTVYVSYFREAWVPSDHDNARLTFDRNIKGCPHKDRFDASDDRDWSNVKIDGVVLEMKFNDKFPNWMRELAHNFNLQRTSLPKYVECSSVIPSMRPRVMMPDDELRI